MYVYNDRRNFRVNMDHAVRFIDVGAFVGRLVIVRAEEDGYQKNQAFKESRDLFLVVDPDVDDVEAVKQTMDTGRNLNSLKSAVEYIETLE